MAVASLQKTAKTARTGPQRPVREGPVRQFPMRHKFRVGSVSTRGRDPSTKEIRQGDSADGVYDRGDRDV